MAEAYRILSLDGGGSWALIEVRALIALYGPSARGHDVLRDFDLAVSNSGGSIVLGGLLADFALGQLEDLFLSQARRESIFSRLGFFEGGAIHRIAGMGPRYATNRKREGLLATLGPIGHEPLPAVARSVVQSGHARGFAAIMVAFDYDVERAVFLRSDPSPAASGSPIAAVSLVDAIHASTNAPVNYFNKPANIGNDWRLWDGAIAGFNNPLMVGVTEALARGVAREKIRALSIGTGTVKLALRGTGPALSEDLVLPRPDQGLLTDIKKLATSILDDPPDTATFVAHVVLGNPISTGPAPPAGTVVRMNPMLSPARHAPNMPWDFPAVYKTERGKADFAALAGLDMDAVEQSEVELIAGFAHHWIAGNVPNQPIRLDRRNLTCEIGHSTFADALTHWNRVK